LYQGEWTRKAPVKDHLITPD